MQMLHTESMYVAFSTQKYELVYKSSQRLKTTYAR